MSRYVCREAMSGRGCRNLYIWRNDSLDVRVVVVRTPREKVFRMPNLQLSECFGRYYRVLGNTTVVTRHGVRGGAGL